MLQQLPAELIEKALHTIGFDGLEPYPIDTGGTVVGLRQPIRFVQRFPPAHMSIQTPKAPRRFRLGLDV